MAKKPVTTYIEETVHAAAKGAAALAQISIAQFIEDAIRKAIPPAFRKSLK